MRIKKDKSTKNEYISADGVWVRNFTKPCVTPVNLSPMLNPADYTLLINNEDKNIGMNISDISDETLSFQNVVIISDGFGFKEKHRVLTGLPKDTAVFAVNRALAKWELTNGPDRRPINLYVVNNPYQECVSYLPDRYYPTCVASSRTNHNFVKKYKGRIYLYQPTMSMNFGISRNASYHVDDYRNPICAAIGLAYHFGVKKLLLMCCDDSFDRSRDGSVYLENGLFTYPQHIKTQRIIDANLYWLTHQEEVEVQVRDCSSGIAYENATSISTEDIVDFFSS